MTIEELARNLIAHLVEINGEYEKTVYQDAPATDRNMWIEADQAFIALHNAIIEELVAAGFYTGEMMRKYYEEHPP